MDVFEAVRTVLAVRSFDTKPVSPELIQKIVQAAHLTGSSMNLQPWHFIVVQDRKMLRRLGKLASTGPYTTQAAFAIIVVIEKSRFAVSDASRAIQSMILTAWEEGLASNWVGFFGLESLNPLLEIPPQMDVLAILPFGYPAITFGKGHKRRKPFAEVASSERFGQPFEKR